MDWSHPADSGSCRVSTASRREQVRSAPLEPLPTQVLTRSLPSLRDSTTCPQPAPRDTAFVRTVHEAGETRGSCGCRRLRTNLLLPAPVNASCPLDFDGEPAYAGYTSWRGVTTAGLGPHLARMNESWGAACASARWPSCNLRGRQGAGVLCSARMPAAERQPQGRRSATDTKFCV